MKKAIVLFAKAPVPGRVKTRLTPLLSPEHAASFHEACLRDAWDKLRELTGVSFLTHWIYVDSACDLIQRLAGPHHWAKQTGHDLGERMIHCFNELHALGYGSVVIVGADSPTLPVNYLRKSLQILDDADAVLGPTEDGGYYAVGCRRPHARMFDRVRWSTSETLRQTQEAMAAIGLRPKSLPRWYDVDTPEDLRRLAREPSLPPNVAAWVKEHQSVLG